jgi:hypothetical protein
MVGSRPPHQGRGTGSFILADHPPISMVTKVTGDHIDGILLFQPRD